MRICRFIDPDGNISYGKIEGNFVKIIPDPFGNTESKEGIYSLESIKLVPPVMPGKILCIGLNYRDHIKETGHEIPVMPVVFMKPSTTVIGPDDEIVYPSISKKVDYEAELAVVIGRRCRNIEETEANDFIFGYTCANDVSARDYQPHNGQWTIGKGFDTFLPLGPFIVDDFNPTSASIQCVLNGKIVQSSNINQLIFSPAYLVSFLSKVMTLNPGDVIITGTPEGIGELKRGDSVEVVIEGIGTLKNHVV